MSSDEENLKEDFSYVKEDTNRKKAVVKLQGKTIVGFVTKHETQDLYWFNTKSRLENKERDLIVLPTDIKMVGVD